jgi:hypothetical protein
VIFRGKGELITFMKMFRDAFPDIALEWTRGSETSEGVVAPPCSQRTEHPSRNSRNSPHDAHASHPSVGRAGADRRL